MDELIMRTVDLFYAVPGLLVILVFVIVFGQSFGLLVFLLALFSWMHYARQVRGETLQLKTLDYVSYARVSGTGTVRILIRHILPGVANTVMIVASPGNFLSTWVQANPRWSRRGPHIYLHDDERTVATLQCESGAAGDGSDTAAALICHVGKLGATCSSGRRSLTEGTARGLCS